MPAISGLYNELIGDADVIAGVSSYRFSSSSPKNPAIFTLPEAPEDAETPFILIRPVAGGTGGNFEDRAYRAGLSIVDIIVFGSKDRSHKVLRESGLAVWKAVHRTRPIDPDDAYEMVCFADYPNILVDPQGFPGCVISCSVTVREKQRSES